MSDKVIDEICDLILEVCNTDEEVNDLISNVVSNIKDLVGDEDYTPTKKDIQLKLKDDRDDAELESDVEDEHIEVVKDDEGFLSLR